MPRRRNRDDLETTPGTRRQDTDMKQEKYKENAATAGLIQAYDRMLQRAESTLGSAAARSETGLRNALDNSRDRAIELGELTREEADRVHRFVSRDLYGIGRHLAEDERDVADWVRLRLLVTEKELSSRFTTLVDAARVELKHLEKAKHRFDEWHTGEVTMIGTLRCRRCGELIHFEHTGHIPPCPKCHASVYDRVKE